MQETLFDQRVAETAPPGQAPLPAKPLEATFLIAGLQHRCSKAALEQFRENDSVVLVREPSNPHDPNAVQVRRLGRHVGYLPRDLAMQVAPCMDAAWATKAWIDVVRPGPSPAAWQVRCVMRCWPKAAGKEGVSA